MSRKRQDKRIAAFFSFCESFLCRMDPDGVLAQARPRSLVIYNYGTWFSWSCHFSLNRQDRIVVAGKVMSSEDDVLIEQVKICLGDKECECLSEGSDRTVKTVCSYEGLVRLEGMLGDPLSRERQASLPLVALFPLVMDALFFGVDGGRPENHFRERFVCLRIDFQQGMSLRVSSIMGSSTTGIKVFCTVNLSGLYGKGVKVFHHYDDGTAFEADCIAGDKPSLVSAFRLYFSVAKNEDSERSMRSAKGVPKVEKTESSDNGLSFYKN